MNLLIVNIYVLIIFDIIMPSSSLYHDVIGRKENVNKLVAISEFGHDEKYASYTTNNTC